MEKKSKDQFPDFLSDYGGFYSHFQSQFESLSSYEKGNKFAKFSQSIAQHTDIG